MIECLLLNYLTCYQYYGRVELLLVLARVTRAGNRNGSAIDIWFELKVGWVPVPGYYWCGNTW